MNYRHAYHAGNFADVLKHIVVAYIARHLAKKDKPFAVIDTHAGVGWYDLAGDEATRSPEWKEGIARLWDVVPPEPAKAALEPFLHAVRALNPDGVLRRYPGSPSVAAELARPGDVISLFELHPEDARTLAQRFDGDARVMVSARDGYGALKGYLPPAQRRGLVLIDPPFEDRDEMAHMAGAAKTALELWPTGTFVFWRPLKDLWASERFDVGLAEWLISDRELAPEKILRVDLWVREIVEEGPLCGAGVVVINPPFGLEEALVAALPWLSETLAQGDGAGWRVDGAITDDSLLVDEF